MCYDPYKYNVGGVMIYFTNVRLRVDPANLNNSETIEMFRHFKSIEKITNDVVSTMIQFDDAVNIDFAAGKGDVSVLDLPVNAESSVSGTLKYDPMKRTPVSLYGEYQGDTVSLPKDVSKPGVLKFSDNGQDNVEYTYKTHLFDGTYSLNKRTGIIYCVENRPEK